MNQTPSSSGVQPGATKPTDVFKPWVTYALMGVTILIFGVQYLTPGPDGVDLLLRWGGYSKSAVLAGEWWRLVTPVFLHMSVLAIILNMYSLYVVGQPVERFLGHIRFAVLYLVSAVAGMVVSVYLSNYTIPYIAGASTAIFGLVVGYAVFMFRNRQFFGQQATGSLRTVFIIVFLNLMFGLLLGVEIWGNIGGLLGGLAFSWAGGPVLVVDQLIGMNSYRVVDSNSGQRFWWVAVIELLVLLGLVALRMFSS